MAGRILKASPLRGRPRVTLARPGGRPFYRYTYQLVLEAFVGPRPAGMEPRHLDGNTRNNQRSNLAWGTPVENEADKRRHGTIATGERNGAAKLTAELVREIRAAGGTQAAIAERYGVSQPTVARVRARRIWAHVE